MKKHGFDWNRVFYCGLSRKENTKYTPPYEGKRADETANICPSQLLALYCNAEGVKAILAGVDSIPIAKSYILGIDVLYATRRFFSQMPTSFHKDNFETSSKLLVKGRLGEYTILVWEQYRRFRRACFFKNEPSSSCPSEEVLFMSNSKSCKTLIKRFCFGKIEDRRIFLSDYRSFGFVAFFVQIPVHHIF